MRALILTLTLTPGFFSGLLIAQDALSIGALPSSRGSVILDPTDRNPYAKQEVPKIEIKEETTDSESEESRIAAVLNKMSVVGRTRTENGWKVLLGDLILEPGRELPALVDGQTRILRVAQIFDTMIEIEWITADSTETPKRTFIPVRLGPAVATALPGREAGAPPVITRSPPTPVEPTPADALSSPN